MSAPNNCSNKNLLRTYERFLYFQFSKFKIASMTTHKIMNVFSNERKYTNHNREINYLKNFFNTALKILTISIKTIIPVSSICKQVIAYQVHFILAFKIKHKLISYFIKKKKVVCYVVLESFYYSFIQ